MSNFLFTGSNYTLETTNIEKEQKVTKKRKMTSSKFMSLGKDQTVSILHGVGRVLNPKGENSNSNLYMYVFDIDTNSWSYFCQNILVIFRILFGLVKPR